VVSVLTEQALEADRAQVVLAESFDIFRLVNLALGHKCASRHAVDRLNIKIRPRDTIINGVL